MDNWFRTWLGLEPEKPKSVDLSTADHRAFFDYLCRVKGKYDELGEEDKEPVVTLREMARPTLPKAPAWGLRGKTLTGVMFDEAMVFPRTAAWWFDSLNGFSTHDE